MRVPRLVQKAQALAEKFCIRFHAARLLIGWHFRTSVE
jgi:hypothetical protein